jgi:type VI secretion system protein ImpG
VALLRAPSQPITPLLTISLRSADPDSHETVTYHPLYSRRHEVQDSSPAYWYSTRLPSNRKGDEGTDVFVSLVNIAATQMESDYDTVTVRCTCTNRDFVTRLPFGSETGDFEMAGAASIKRIVALRKPTRTLRPPMDGKTLWYLTSHLSLNYLSLVDEGKESL